MKLKSMLLLAFVGAVLAVGLLAAGSMLPASEYHPTNEETWAPSLETGLETAQSEDKPVLVYVWSEDCSHCKEFAAELEDDERLQSSIDAFVPVAMEWENAQQIRSQYPIRGTPTFVVLTDDGTEVTTFVPTGVDDPAAVLDAARQNATAMS